MAKAIRFLLKINISISILLLMVFFNTTNAQERLWYHGLVFDAENNEPLPFTHIAFLDSTQTELITGTVSDMDGRFYLEIMCENAGVIRFTSIGYEEVIKNICTDEVSNLDLGIIYLKFSVLMHEAITVYGEVPVRSEAGRVSYYISESMMNTTVTGTDILKIIPGIQVDLLQNISLEGSQNIIIFVDGKERDRGYISQLSASQIDRIDVMNMPSSAYDAGVAGAINIVLNRNVNSGLKGHIHMEAPLSSSEAYLFPSYSLHYSTENMNLYTSYNGEFSYFDIVETSARKWTGGESSTEWNTTQLIQQETWSNKFHFGLDYFINEKNEFSLYGWVNTFSNEHSGDVESRRSGDIDGFWSATKDDNDSNRSHFNSINYKFRPGGSTTQEFRFDTGFYNRTGSNEITYSNREAGNVVKNHQKPSEQTFRFRIDHTVSLTGNFTLESGIHSTSRIMKDSERPDFRYSDKAMAGYSSLWYNSANFDVNGGLRVEKVDYGTRSSANDPILDLFPNLSMQYRLSESSQRISLSYRRSVTYPHLYQLNPQMTVFDPYTIWHGNPELKPSLKHEVRFTHSFQFLSNFLSTQLFFNQESDVIYSISRITEQEIFETGLENMGNKKQAGVQFTGSLNVSSRTAIQPFLKLYQVNLKPGLEDSRLNRLNFTSHGYESGLTAYTDLGRGFNASFMYQYSSPDKGIQRSEYSSALYFINIEKSFRNGITAGLASALPFSKSMTYHGYEMNIRDIMAISEGNIHLSSIPLWLRLNYQFSRGSTKDKIVHEHAVSSQIPRKGF